MRLVIHWDRATRDKQYKELLENRLASRLVELHGSDDEAKDCLDDFNAEGKPPFHAWNLRWVRAWGEVAPMLSPCEQRVAVGNLRHTWEM